MKLLCQLSAMLLLTGSGMAGELGSLDEKPWLGVWAGMEGRSFDFVIRTDGSSEIHLKKAGKRTSSHNFFMVRYVVEEETRKGKWTKRKMSPGGLDSAQEATLDEEKVTFTATYTGETKVEITHEFDKSEVLIGVKVLEKKTANPLRVGVEVVVPDLFKHLDADLKERELKKMLKGHEYRMVRSDGKRLKLDGGDLNDEDLKLENPELVGTKSLKSFEVESPRMNGREVSLTTEEEDFGVLMPRQTKPLMHGLYVYWWPKEDKIGKEGCRLQIEVK